jgi:hypothetical protein
MTHIVSLIDLLLLYEERRMLIFNFCMLGGRRRQVGYEDGENKLHNERIVEEFVILKFKKMLTNEGGKITSRLAPLVRTQYKQLYELLHS